MGLTNNWNRTRTSLRRVACPQIWRKTTSATTPRSPLGMSGSATLGRLSMLYLELSTVWILANLGVFSLPFLQEHWRARYSGQGKPYRRYFGQEPYRQRTLYRGRLSEWLHYHKHSILRGALTVYICDYFGPRFYCPCSDPVHKSERVIFTISLMNFYRKSSFFLADWQTGRLPPKDFLALELLLHPCSISFLKEKAPSPGALTWALSLPNVVLQTSNCRRVSREYSIGSETKKKVTGA